MSTTLRRVVTLTAALFALSACSPRSQAPVGATAAKELSAVSSFKTQYKGIVTGTDVKGSTLLVYVDVENLYSMDEDAEDAMKAQLLSRWKRVWSSQHPHKHATVHLSMRDYYGKEIYSASTHT